MSVLTFMLINVYFFIQCETYNLHLIHQQSIPNVRLCVLDPTLVTTPSPPTNQIDSNTTVETFERTYIRVYQHIELRTAQVNLDNISSYI